MSFQFLLFFHYCVLLRSAFEEDEVGDASTLAFYVVCFQSSFKLASLKSLQIPNYCSNEYKTKYCPVSVIRNGQC